jgi:hypothetical protein
MMDTAMPYTNLQILSIRAAMKAIVAGTGILLMAATVSPASACISSNAGQRILRDHFVTIPGEPVRLTILDLLSVSLPGQVADDWRVEAGTIDTPLLRLLTQEQLASAKQSPRFVTFNKPGAAAQSGATTGVQLHFGAVSVGRTTITFVNDAMRPAARRTLDIEVSSRSMPQATRGTLKKADPAHADQAIAMQYYDTLEITLPGKSDDSWDTGSAAAAGLMFKEKRAASADTVTLVFRPTSASSRSVVLTLSNGAGKNYSFQIQHQPTPIC